MCQHDLAPAMLPKQMILWPARNLCVAFDASQRPFDQNGRGADARHALGPSEELSS